MILGVIGAFFATVFFSILFNISTKHLLYCGLAGALGWLFYLMGRELTSSIVFGSFAGSFGVAFFSHILAKIKKTPVTVFLIGGILPIVPGAGMYRTVYAIINQDFNSSLFYLAQTLAIAGVIAMAIFINDGFFRMKKPSKRKKTCKQS